MDYMLWIVVLCAGFIGIAIFAWAAKVRQRNYREFVARRDNPREVTSDDLLDMRTRFNEAMPDMPPIESTRFDILRTAMLDAVIRKSKEFDGDMVQAAKALGHKSKIAHAIADEIALLAGEPLAQVPPNMGGVDHPPYQGPNYFAFDRKAVSRDYRSDEQIAAAQFGKHPRRED
jgi:hypothetical protein